MSIFILFDRQSDVKYSIAILFEERKTLHLNHLAQQTNL